jgi:hypothetical protein
MAVNAEHSEYAAAKPRWERARDAAAGQDAVHEKGVAYLPKLSGQTEDEYKAYKGRALYYGATGRTVDGMSGLIFRRAPTIEIPAAVSYLEEDVDTSGTPLVAFCEKVVEELLQAGRIGLLADFPPMEGVRTLAEEREAGARPFVTTYSAESVLNWKVERVGNRSTLTLVVLAEMAEVPKDEYESEQVPRWRVLRLGVSADEAGKVRRVYTQELWEKTKDAAGKESFVMVEGYPKTPLMANRPMDFIPFLVCGPMGIDVCVAKPPILDLADVNLSHYRTTADYEHGLHFTGLPTPIVTGHTFEDGEKFALGSSIVKAFENPQAKAFFLEFSGEGLSALSRRLEEKEAMMAALGARMLASEKKAAEAAETAAIHRAGENSVLGSLAIAASAAISKALTWCVKWSGGQGEAKVELNTDYLPAGMTPQELSELVKAWQSGAIDHETLFDNLQRGEIARQGETFETMKGRLEAEGPSLGMIGEGAGAKGQ